MRVTGYSFGPIRVDRVTYDHDLILDRGKVRKRNKAASRKFRGGRAHPAVDRGEHPVAMPPAGGRQRTAPISAIPARPMP